MGYNKKIKFDRSVERVIGILEESRQASGKSFDDLGTELSGLWKVKKSSAITYIITRFHERREWVKLFRDDSEEGFYIKKSRELFSDRLPYYLNAINCARRDEIYKKLSKISSCNLYGNDILDSMEGVYEDWKW